MAVRSTSPFSFQFATHNPDNLIVVENQGDRVLFRAAYNNFSDRRKAFLIRQLAAEGYIPDGFESTTEFSKTSGLTWVIDRSLLHVNAEATRRCARFMSRLVLAGCLLWVLEILMLFLAGQPWRLGN